MSLYWKFKDKWANSVDPDEVAHNEPPHLDLYCLQLDPHCLLILLVSFLVFQALTNGYNILKLTKLFITDYVSKKGCSNDKLNRETGKQ